VQVFVRRPTLRGSDEAFVTVESILLSLPATLDQLPPNCLPTTRASVRHTTASFKSACGKLAIYDTDSQATTRLVVGSDSTPGFPASSSMQTRGNAQRHGLPNYPCESAALSAWHCGTRNRAIRLPKNRCFRPKLITLSISNRLC